MKRQDRCLPAAALNEKDVCGQIDSVLTKVKAPQPVATAIPRCCASQYKTNMRLKMAAKNRGKLCAHSDLHTQWHSVKKWPTQQGRNGSSDGGCHEGGRARGSPKALVLQHAHKVQVKTAPQNVNKKNRKNNQPKNRAPESLTNSEPF